MLILIGYKKQYIMKDIQIFNKFLGQLVLIFIISGINIASGQDVNDHAAPIPDEINRIFKASCMKCHDSKGKALARIKVNFSTWTEYSSQEGAKKASASCSELVKESMPPKRSRKSNPELIPSKEQIESICIWAESLKLKEAEKHTR